MVGKKSFNLELTDEEESILHGQKGEILQKVMQTVVEYGEACGASRLVSIEGNAHLVISHAFDGLGPSIQMMDELINAGLKIKKPFTANPRPFDCTNIKCTREQKRIFRDLYKRQDYYEEQLKKLGLRDERAYTCTSYFPEVGNIPKKDTILAWSESSAVVYANSVLGARTNRNAAIFDLLCNIIGKAPLFGLLTEDGRRAHLVVELRTDNLPNSQLLGGVIGEKAGEEVPYIIGLDYFLGTELTDKSRDYLKDMGAACAAIGAVGLYHVENITPEAKEQKRGILRENSSHYIIDNEEIKKTKYSYSVLWKNNRAKPRRCLIGCPHLSLNQLNWWTKNIYQRLEESGKEETEFDVVLCSAPEVIEKFREDKEAYAQISTKKIILSSMCIETFMNNRDIANEPVITNSNKLRAYTTARFFEEQELLEIIACGEI